MPIYNSPIFAVDPVETRRYAGLQRADFKEELIDAACTEAQLLIQPKGIWTIYDYDAEKQLITPGDVTIQGKVIGKHLKDCDKVVMIAATVGEDIENQVTKNFENGKYSFSMLLDAAATTAVEQIADAMEKTIYNEVKRHGYAMKWRFSPGYGDWPLTQQPEVIKLAKGNEIGMSLTDSLMLMPRKSITAIIGLYRPKADCKEPAHQKHDCSKCNKLDCQARKA